jgi:hypothetical protein
MIFQLKVKLVMMTAKGPLDAVSPISVLNSWLGSTL